MSIFGGLATLAGSALSAYGQHSANQGMLSLNKSNRNWQEYMSNTAHQREVADLRSAGLNPILSGFGGSGAAVGGTAGVQLGNEFEGVDSSLNSARDYFGIERQKLQIERDLKESNVDLNEKQTQLASANIAKTVQDTITSSESAKALQTQQALNMASASERYQAGAMHSAQSNLINQQAVLGQLQEYGIKNIPGQIVNNAKLAVTPPFDSKGRRTRENNWYDDLVDWEAKMISKAYHGIKNLFK